MKPAPTISFIPFEESHAHAFHDLNMEWIKKYFVVEEKDEKVLSDPQKYIIKPGGDIIMAVDENQKAIGTVAMVKLNTNDVELSKMAVASSHQGLGIGKKLIAQVLEEAKKQNYRSVILYSNKTLGAAIHLYKKFGFEEIPLEKEIIYVRSDIKMK